MFKDVSNHVNLIWSNQLVKLLHIIYPPATGRQTLNNGTIRTLFIAITTLCVEKSASA